LCLYFEPPAAVMRTWTPQHFFATYTWWLEKSARGELHPADQPVEHLFFASKYELVLPWNLAEFGKDPALRFEVVRRQEHLDEGFTCFLEVIPKDGSKVKATAHIELTLPPVVHGFVEHDPVTLGQLADLLSRRKVDMISPLRATLQKRVGDDGVAASADEKGAAARRQSGISEEGPAGVLIGAGSLGSALLNLWGRSGWDAGPLSTRITSSRTTCRGTWPMRSISAKPKLRSWRDCTPP
jgi:hypothetical protein